MVARIALRSALVAVVCVGVLSCNGRAASRPVAPDLTLEAASPTAYSRNQTAASAEASPIPSSAAAQGAPAITSVEWEPTSRSVHIGIDPWPKTWEPWTLYVDGVEIPTGNEAVDVRPNAPLSSRPDGVIVGSLPWVGGLDNSDFPCCGSLRFSVPGLGQTNAFDYNLRDAGCVSASAKVCRAEWTVHEGDWIIAGGSETLENVKLVERGNIYIRGGATLTLRNSELKFERGDTPTIHTYIFVDPGATLMIDTSRVYPAAVDGGLTCVWNRGKTTITNSPTQIHYLDMGDNATLQMDNSSMIYDLGGLLQVAGGKTHLTNSTIGALALAVPPDGHLTASGLRAGSEFQHWTVQELIPEASYELVFENVKLLEDFPPGPFEHGPYERGWIFFLDRSSHVQLSDSEVRKIFLDLQGDSVEFQNLRIGEPSSLTYRDIVLQDVTASGQWAFTLSDANVTFRDSTYLFLQPSGSSNLNLINSHMVEFIPRNFTGTIRFENAEWGTAGEILGGVGYHSARNDFKMTGSLRMAHELRTNLQWKDARVRREFEAILTDPQGVPISQGVLKINGREYVTDSRGQTTFTIMFDEDNYNVPTSLEAWVDGTRVDLQAIDFFTETPIRLGQ